MLFFAVILINEIYLTIVSKTKKKTFTIIPSLITLYAELYAAASYCYFSYVSFCANFALMN